MLRWRIIIALVFALALSATLQIRPHAGMMMNKVGTGGGEGAADSFTLDSWSTTKSANITRSGTGNVTETGNCASAWCSIIGTKSYTTGKHYMVMTIVALTSNIMFGVCGSTVDTANYIGVGLLGGGYQQTQTYYHNGSQGTQLAAVPVATNQITLAVDLGNKNIWAKVNAVNTNGTWSSVNNDGLGVPSTNTKGSAYTMATAIFLCVSNFQTEAFTMQPGVTDSDTALSGFSPW